MAGSGNILETDRTATRLSLCFFSTMESVDKVCSEVNGFLESHKALLSSHLFSVNLVLREGLTNAVRHGNKSNPEKTVHVDVEIVHDQVLKIRISDQGEGFDWQQAQETAMPDDADHGRGMPIMKSYFSAFQYNQKGNVLYLEKQLRPQV